MKKNERTEKEYRDAASKSFSIAGMCRELGLGRFGANYRRIHKAIEKYSIDVNHFTGQGWNVAMAFNPSTRTKKDLKEILVQNSTYDNTNTLRLRILSEGLKEHKCEKCGRSEWEGEIIPLQLHHINGIRNDNRIENLQLLCPNCHALTDNYCGKNKDKKSIGKKLTIKEKYEEVKKVYGEKVSNELYGNILNYRKNVKVKKYCPICGNEITDKRSKYCSLKCSHNAQRKLPSDNVMIQHINEGKSNVEIASLYGVSEASVRKWKRDNIKKGSVL